MYVKIQQSSWFFFFSSFRNICRCDSLQIARQGFDIIWTRPKSIIKLIGAPVLWGEAERAGPIQAGVQEVQGEHHQCIQISEKWVQRVQPSSSGVPGVMTRSNEQVMKKRMFHMYSRKHFCAAEEMGSRYRLLREVVGSPFAVSSISAWT